MADDFERILRERVLLLDGAMGVMLLRHGTSNPDMLSLTHPGLVARVHDAYLAAGADIIETDTFSANELSQRRHETAGRVREMNIAAARIARERTDACMDADPSRPRFVGGSMGPAFDPLSSASEDKHPVGPEIRQKAYADQAAALIEGGVDLLMIETVMDAADAGCALAGAREAMRRNGKEVPVTVAATISGATGRLLSGHSPEEFLAAAAPYAPAAVGFNCSEGPASLAGPVRHLTRHSPFPLILYPNAGLPDAKGGYGLGPDDFAAELLSLLPEGIPAIAGGCCGTTPAHTAALARHLLYGKSGLLM